MKILALEDYDERLLTMKDLIRTLPPPNYILLKRIIEHLERVTDYEEINHMYATNLAIVFGPTLLRPGGTSANSFATSMKNLGHQQNIVRNMILQYHWLFDVEDEEGAAEEAEGDGETEEGEAAISVGEAGVDDEDEDEENEFPEILEDSDEDEYEEEEEVYVLSAAPSTPLTPTFTTAGPNATTTRTATATTGGGGGALKENNDRAMKDQRRKTIIFG
jgi:hypothetical protein